MSTQHTLDELELALGEQLKRLRLNKNWDQKTLAARAGVSVRALRNIEAGRGSTLKTLLGVVRALGRESWLQTIAPVATIDPLTLTRRAFERVRATSPRVKLRAAQRLVQAADQAQRDGQPAPATVAELQAARRTLAAARGPEGPSISS